MSLFTRTQAFTGFLFNSWRGQNQYFHWQGKTLHWVPQVPGARSKDLLSSMGSWGEMEHQGFTVLTGFLGRRWRSKDSLASWGVDGASWIHCPHWVLGERWSIRDSLSYLGSWGEMEHQGFTVLTGFLGRDGASGIHCLHWVLGERWSIRDSLSSLASWGVDGASGIHCLLWVLGERWSRRKREGHQLFHLLQ